ncbi:MAG: ferrous iron transport protein B [Thermoplasmata archaeon]|nr:ferrous iron transport protein B [Thermoplasmata archaeon]
MAAVERYRIALAGNPNVGKTTLFNAMTGMHQHVGNFPGVTVERRSGRATRDGVELEVVDLPGTYSLTAYSLDEVVAREYIVEERPDVVVQVVDATNLERNLYLTTQLMELGVRVVIALNMADLVDARGDFIDTVRMREFLEIPVVRTTAVEGAGVEELIATVIAEARLGPHHEHEIGYGEALEVSIADLERILARDPDIERRYRLRWAAVKLLEGDERVLEGLVGSPVEADVRSFLAGVDQVEVEAIMADKRYEAINAVLPHVCSRCVPRMTASDMIDRVLMNRYLGIPIFLALMWGAFELTFTLATPFSTAIDMGFAWMVDAVNANMEPAWLASLLGDGVIGGVGFVIVFVPNIFILFLLISFLEDSGYLARAAFIMDRLMYKLGLHGKSFIPMLMGFGCNVPAIMATRVIEDRRDRIISIIVTPFISCGARLPIYVLFAGAFFGRQAGAVIFSLYVLGIAAAVLSAKLLRRTVLRGRPSAFIMELPPYRLPTLRSSARHMWEHGSMYLRKAGSVILLGALVMWALASYPAGVEYGSSESYAGMVGRAIAPALAPLGLDWRIAVALLFGLVAKEIVVSSLGVLYGAGSGDGASLSDGLQADSGLHPLNAYGAMAFTLLYMPCIATVAVIRKETGSWKWTLFALAYGLALAWTVAFAIFQGGTLLGFGR